MLTSYKQLIVWKKAVDFTVDIYKTTKKFPKTEIFSLVSQIRSAAVAIPSNIAEGYARGHRKEYLQFLKIAYASGAECETQLIIASKVKYLSLEEYHILSSKLVEIMRMSYSLLQKLT